MHEHFDADGEKTGQTIIHRESVWNDEARGRALRLIEYEDSLCRCGCGLPMTVAHDKTKTFLVDTVTCHAGKALDKVTREKKAEAEAAKTPAGWDDGLHYVVRELDPDNPASPAEPQGETKLERIRARAHRTQRPGPTQGEPE